MSKIKAAVTEAGAIRRSGYVEYVRQDSHDITFGWSQIDFGQTLIKRPMAEIPTVPNACASMESDTLSLDALFARIRSIPLGRAERDALAGTAMGVRAFDRGETIFDSDQYPSQLHIISAGWAARSISSMDGSRQITDFAIAGDLCDLTALGHSSVGRVTALTAVRATVLNRQALTEAISAYPKLGRAFMSIALVEQATLRVWLAYMGRHEKTTHLAHLFCELHARLRQVGLVGDHSFELPLTQDAIADTTGMSIVHVNRVLRVLRTDGLITLHKHHLEILQPQRLRELAEFDPAYLFA
ncbi:Crp/Fnr family transcriptional regulator [Mesorhizobium intechi]|uniref:Crp/Fnr family transcriptional regulator n=1 Tax=Mesorhizobium intechi TaxID=537601 RepID=A0A8T9ARR0_9HYPH|nr:Crp/Fnr family transcriptional regulator [Mesorhizobium intechi]